MERMMHEFLTANRAELIARCRAKVAQRAPPGAPVAELDHGVSIFLDQLIKTLAMERTGAPLQSYKVSGPAGGGRPALSEMSESATRHGKELLEHGFTVEEVVHDYGDLCQSISDLASETGADIETEEFRTLNRCLDNAIASAVTEFGYQRDSVIAGRQAVALNERLGFFAHELRNQLCTATLALSVIRQGNVGLNGATGGVLDRALVGLGNLIDRSLAEVRMDAGLEVQHQLFSLAEFIAEIRLSATLEAQVKECPLTVSDVDPLLAVDGDRDLLLAATGNLLQNAFKFTHPHSEVTLNAYAQADRILIDVQDHCGGLAPNVMEEMFSPFKQGAEDRSGLGLGLSISRRSVEANNGVLSVRDVPGSGCVFTIDLPRHFLPGAQPAAETA
ncbi:HAMP domain-containing sensor histidine kinase [Luteimonas sp. RD2P54]|uniref:histidine kinase n=1 Tax=Luteimonas endophytica TaxID=3042023 RepID=A0ABT6JEP6_9GAMM|nr:HAMP domain-containing sensor histidine kinase [Luteimonas endophytica]MDH5824668.1 HAMP domain-containing sensor histidine kinase [Luteimonas endophytica]